jgi:hypothetical protein
VYKDRLAAADEKLRALRHKEREFVQMQKLKYQTEVGLSLMMAAPLYNADA